MALPATTVWEVETGGSDTNGGGFDSAGTGTDYSQQAAKNTVGSNISTVDAVGAGTTTITSATAAFTTAITGNIVYLAGGSGSLAAGWYRATYVSAASITVDRSVAAGTGITLNIGGALASPGQAGGLMVAGNDLYIKAGTYSITSATANVGGATPGCLSLTAGVSASNATKVIGYQATRGDGGTKPLLQANGISTFTLVTAATQNHIENIAVDGAGLTSGRGFSFTANRAGAFKCKALNCSNSGFAGFSAQETGLNLCEATGCSGSAGIPAAYTLATCLGCTAHDNTTTGFSGCLTFSCIAANNSGSSSDGFSNNNSSGTSANCTAYLNGRDGFRYLGTVSRLDYINCLAESNGGYGFNAGSATDLTYLYNCAGYNNTSGLVQTAVIPAGQQIGLITCTAEIFTNAGSNDFSLNNTTNGGKSCRAAGITGAFPGLSTTGFLDVGAAQHQDSGGGPVMTQIIQPRYILGG
jgi:hypothetical protein